MTDIKEYFVTGLKLSVVSIISVILWFVVVAISAALSGSLGVISILLWLVASIAVNGYVARQLWKWK